MDNRSRRDFLRGSAAVLASGFVASSGIEALTALSAQARHRRRPPRAERGEGGYGPLKPAGDGALALPEGFTYAMFGVEGTPMADGNVTPKAHDGMAAFAMPNGNVRLVRNHEVRDAAGVESIMGDESTAYDRLGAGGTTTLEIEVTEAGDRELVRDFVSLNGTIVNCAGGPTPWGSWLSCEETTAGRRQGWDREHGYVFEVPLNRESPAASAPLKALGRFVHEAVALDPQTGVVYETEDRDEAGFYRFTPDAAGVLAEGGSLEVLAVSGKPAYDTRRGQVVGRRLGVQWVPIHDPDPPNADSNPSAVFEQGREQGAAIFGRLEGCWWGNGAVYFNATSGGNAASGQVWEYRPRGGGRGVLTLIFESQDPDVLSGPDNITVSPRGGLLICEDGRGPQFLRGVTPDGRIFDFAQNLLNNREWAGASFDPAGSTLFVNIQGDTSRGGPGHRGRTFAIWGPWDQGAL